MEYEVFRNGRRVGAAGDSFVDYGLTPATSYSYTVRETDAYGGRVTSSPVYATTMSGDGGPPPGGGGAPISFGHSLNGDRRSDLLWKENGLAFAYYNAGVNNGIVNWTGNPQGAPYQVGEGWGLPGENYYFPDLNGDGRSDLLWKENGLAFAYYNAGVNNGIVNWTGNPQGAPYQVGEGWGLPGENYYPA
jgi:hypothetical protein